MNKTKSALRAGFTLIELLLVILILGILGTVVVVNFGDVGGDARKTATLTSIGSIEQACTLYSSLSAKGYPKTLEDLAKGINDRPPLLKAADLKDAWGNPFDYKVENGMVKITSAGPDGQLNTEDDLTN